jgi:uncharacterized protein (TIGR02246 family)
VTTVTTRPLARLVLAGVFLAPAALHAQRSSLQQEIDSLNRAMEQAFAKGDMAAVAKFYADDAKLMGPRGSDISGRSAIDQYWRSIKGAKSWKLDALDVGGDRTTAYQVGRSTLVTAGASGDQTSVSRFVVIWKRQPDGRFRIALDFYHF